MGNSNIDTWFNVNKDIRVYSGHSENSQKLGWIYAPAAIFAIDDYGGSYQFKETKVVGEGRLDYAVSPFYPQSWVRMADVTLEPFGAGDSDPVSDPDPADDVPPVPTTDPLDASNAQLGAAFRLLVNFILGR